MPTLKAAGGWECRVLDALVYVRDRSLSRVGDTATPPGKITAFRFTCQHRKALPRKFGRSRPNFIITSRGEQVPRESSFSHLKPVFLRCDTGRTHLVSEPLRARSGVECAVFVPRTQADHPIVVLNLAGINLVHLFTVVLLAGPLC